MAFAGPGLETAGDPAVGDHEQVASGDDGRGDIGGAASRAPSDVRVGDVAPAAGPYCEGVPLRVAAGRKDVFSIVNHRRNKLLSRAIDNPVALAIARIVTGDTKASGEDHLSAAVDLADDRRDVAAGFVFAPDSPTFPAGLAIERDEIGVAIVVAVEDHQVFKKHRAGVEAVRADEVADVGFPLFVSVQIVGGDDDFAGSDEAIGADIRRDDPVTLGAHERDVNLSAVCGRSAGGTAVESVNRFRWRLHNVSLPDRLAAGPVEAEQDAFVLFGKAASEENLVAPNDRRRVAFTGNGDSPGNVFRAAPPGRDAFFRAGSITVWPAPTLPIFGLGQPCHKKEQHNQTHAGSLASLPSGTRINSLFDQSDAEVMPRVPVLAVYNVAHAFWESCFPVFHPGWPSDGGTTLVVATLETSGGSAGC